MLEKYFIGLKYLVENYAESKFQEICGPLCHVHNVPTLDYSINNINDIKILIELSENMPISNDSISLTHAGMVALIYVKLIESIDQYSNNKEHCN